VSVGIGVFVTTVGVSVGPPGVLVGVEVVRVKSGTFVTARFGDAGTLVGKKNAYRSANNEGAMRITLMASMLSSQSVQRTGARPRSRSESGRRGEKKFIV